MDPQASSDCEPLSLTRSIAEFPIGNIPLWQHQKIAVANAGLANEGISLHPHAWLAMLDLTTLTGAIDTLVDAFLVPLAWRGTTPDPTRTVAATGSFLIRHPWDFLRANEAYVAGLQKSELLGEVHSSAVLEGIVHLGVGSRILPGVFIEGNVVVGAISLIATGVAGVTTVTNGAPFVNGMDAESDAALRNRFALYVAASALRGLVTRYGPSKRAHGRVAAHSDIPGAGLVGA